MNKHQFKTFVSRLTIVCLVIGLLLSALNERELSTVSQAHTVSGDTIVMPEMLLVNIIEESMTGEFFIVEYNDTLYIAFSTDIKEVNFETETALTYLGNCILYKAR